MRVTSKMMQSNALNNINRNKSYMSTKANQYSTQQKIQRPSEDPVVAVRSLKYRTSISALEQYAKKNVPDAMSWISNTESALTSVNTILTKMNTYFNQGANDTLETTERDALVQTLTEYKSQIFQCLDSDYAGRYLFTGYRTDTSLTFDSETKDLSYTIKETVDTTDLKTFTYVTSNLEYNASSTASDYAQNAADSKKGYKFSLSYNDIENISAISYKVSDGTVKTMDITTVSIVDKADYDLSAETGVKAVLVKETGEIMLSQTAYETLKNASEISVSYDKNSFQEDEVRPEHYFECTMTDANGKMHNYQKPGSQQIQYEVNFSQSITVNTLAKDVLDFDIINQMDDIINQIKNVQDVEKKLSDVETMIKNGTYAGSKDDINELKSQLKNDLALQKSVLQEKFGNGITTTTTAQASVNKAVADLGSRYKRLELTESRLDDQLTSFTEMLTKNDKVDLEDAIVNYTAALTAYNASLNATAKIAQNSLLDFL